MIMPHFRLCTLSAPCLVFSLMCVLKLEATFRAVEAKR